MGNCLVTKLKGSVNNDNLLKVGEFVVKFFHSASVSDSWNRYINVGNLDQVNPTTIRIIGNGYFTDSTFTQNLGKTISAVGDITAYVSDEQEDVTVAIGYNYRLGAITLGYNGYMDIDQLQFNQFTRCSAIRFLQGDETKPKNYGNIKSFENFWIDCTENNGRLQIHCSAIAGSIEDINLNHVYWLELVGASNITGNIENIVVAPNITKLSISNTKISGSIETFLEHLLAAGKADTMQISSYDNNTTWNSVVGGHLGSIDVSFGTNSITVSVNGTTIGEYNGSNWSYPNP